MKNASHECPPNNIEIQQKICCPSIVAAAVQMGVFFMKNKEDKKQLDEIRIAGRPQSLYNERK